MKKLIGGGIVLAVIIAAIAGGSSNNSASTDSTSSSSSSRTEGSSGTAKEARVQLIAHRSSCYQLPEAAEVSFWFYLRDAGNRAATYSKDATPERTTIDAHTVFSVQNTGMFPRKIPAHDQRVIHANLPADGTKLIVSCKALIGDREVPITLRD